MSQTKTLQKEVEALKNKTEMNRAQALEAKAAADAALSSVTDTNKVSGMNEQSNTNLHTEGENVKVQILHLI